MGSKVFNVFVIDVYMDEKKGLDVRAMEEKWGKYWEKEKVYSFDRRSKKKIYSIDTPPPTVSGRMHIGHAFSYSQEDFIARYKRMKGFNVFYPFGTDDNGLPTERLVERTKNVKSKEMNREKFIDLCLKTLKEILPDFVQDWKNLGISCDYDIYYSTIDENTRKISQEYFLELLNKGAVYNADFPAIYCPECQTPIAQAELEDKEKSSDFVYMKAEIEGGGEIVFATTRPELLHACVCISVHKDDQRYKKLVGKKAKIPISGVWVPIITDEFAKIDFGTGAVYWCPYGDKNDVAFLQRHKEFTPTIVLNKDGTLNEKVGKYSGLKIKEARKQIIEDLKAGGHVVKVERIEHVANVHDKCGAEVEFLPVNQWFIRILSQKKKLIERGRKIKWLPEFMFKRYKNWIEGLDWDWSASRSRHFGIPVPLWRCDKCGEVIVPDKKELPVDPVQMRKKCKCGEEAVGENQVIDTWVTSSLTPQIASALVGGKVKLPYSLRPQAHDIIRTWAFYTIVRAHYHDGKIPWKNIVISGFVTRKGEKMSKSKGNVISPQEKMDEYGADAMRYAAASQSLGQDVDFSDKELIAGKKFVTKVWNAANFVFMNLEHQSKKGKLYESDRLFLVQLNKLIDSVGKSFDEYNYARAKSEIDNFFWKVFADNYLEIVKYRVYNGSKEERASAFYTLYGGLLCIIKLMAPITPYIMEEIYQNNFREFEKEKSVHLTEWPEKFLVSGGKNSDESWKEFLSVISKVRQAKSEAKKSMKSEIKLSLGKKEIGLLKEVIEDLKGVCNAKEIKDGKWGVEFVER